MTLIKGCKSYLYTTDSFLGAVFLFDADIGRTGKFQVFDSLSGLDDLRKIIAVFHDLKRQCNSPTSVIQFLPTVFLRFWKVLIYEFQRIGNVHFSQFR